MGEIDAWLNELDERRYSEPRAVFDEALAGIESVPLELMPLWYGVTCSALRMAMEYKQAEKYGQEGLVLADKLLDHAAAGNLHQRISMVYWARLEYERALDENCRAIARHLDADNEVGRARSFVHRGIFLGCMGRFEWSTQAFQRALEDLPPTEDRYRAAGFHGIFCNNMETGVGTLQENLDLLRKAEALERDELHKGKNLWANGSLLVKHGIIEEGISRLREAASTLLSISPTHCALARLDHARALIQSGRAEEANQVILGTNELLHPLRHHRVTCAALLELGSLAFQNKLTLALLDGTKARVLEATQAKRRPTSSG